MVSVVFDVPLEDLLTREHRDIPRHLEYADRPLLGLVLPLMLSFVRSFFRALLDHLRSSALDTDALFCFPPSSASVLATRHLLDSSTDPVAALLLLVRS
jgi:hypothetical protein